MRLKACFCVQARLKDKEAAQAQASKLEAENQDLVQRLVTMKSTEVERMNELNKAYEEMVSLVWCGTIAYHLEGAAPLPITSTTLSA